MTIDEIDTALNLLKHIKLLKQRLLDLDDLINQRKVLVTIGHERGIPAILIDYGGEAKTDEYVQSKREELKHELDVRLECFNKLARSDWKESKDNKIWHL